MNLIPKFLRTKSKSTTGVVGLSSSSQGVVFNRTDNADYENLYPTAKKAEQAFAKIRPYAVDKAGQRIMRPPSAVTSLYRPNDVMSGYRFRVGLAGSYLMHDATYIRVWFEGDAPTADNIYGYTFLEGVSPRLEHGKKIFQTNYGTYTSDEVLTIPSGVNPFHVESGYSQARAARRWTTLDDYIADYQSSFFRNGAIPAGQFVITAPTIKEFTDIKDKMQSAHRGAEKSNNVIYTHRPTDSDGQPNAATVEWVSYDQKNKDLAIKDLVDSTRDRVDSVSGVPKQITGLIEDTHYNGVRLAEYITTEYVARPMAIEIWDAFTHELNRITGGTGFALDFDLETPIVQDEELVKSQRKQTDLQTIRSAQEAGYTLESVIKAFEYPDTYLVLEQQVEEEQEEEVTDDREDLPIQDEEREFQSRMVEIDNKLDLVMSKLMQDKEPIVNKIVLNEETEILNKDVEVQEEEPEEDAWIRQVKEVAQTRIDEHVDSILSDLPNLMERTVKKQIDPDEEDNENFRNALLAVLLPILAIRGAREYDRGQSLILDAGLDASQAVGWEMTEAIQNRYSQYLDKVATSYNTETAEKARRVLAQAQAEGLPMGDIRNQLNELKQLEGYRAERLARSEVHRTQGRGSVDAMREIKDQTGYKIEKIWRVAGPNPCEFCIALDGTVVDVEENFIDLNQTVTGKDGGQFTNDFVGADSADLHPNDECRIEYRVSE